MYTLNCKGRLLAIDQPVVMGIVNINDDSFYSDSRHGNDSRLLSTVEKMLQDGATFIDIGGQSTRPGSVAISEAAELQRVVAAIENIQKQFPEALISIDTFRARVAAAAVAAGASLINDISAGNMDDQMLDTVAALQVPYILMHMKGVPETMQAYTQYEDLLQETLQFLVKKKGILLEKGVKDIIIDPGFGFSKTIEQNFALLKKLEAFKLLECPILLGISRKSTIYKTLGTGAPGALNGTTVLNTMGLLNGATILRVHDVQEAMECIKLYEAYSNS